MYLVKNTHLFTKPAHKSKFLIDAFDLCVTKQSSNIPFLGFFILEDKSESFWDPLIFYYEEKACQFFSKSISS